MSDFAKSDGAKIEITFDQPITSDASGNEGHFTVTAKEYTYVPGGTLVDVVKAVKSVYNKSSLSGTIDMSSGTVTDAEISDGKLQLGVA